MSWEVTLGSITMDETADGNGIYWCAEMPDGILGGPGVQQFVSPNGDDGSVVTASYTRAREIVLAGVAYKPGLPLGDSDFETAYDTLQAVADAAILADETLTVAFPGGDRSWTVRVPEGGWRAERVGAMQWLRFEVDLLAADPDYS